MAKEKISASKTVKSTGSATEPKDSRESGFAIPASSYKFIIIGFLVVIIGFFLMSGGGSKDPSVFNPEIFSFRRITLAPLVVMAGFIEIGWAIMRRPVRE